MDQISGQYQLLPTEDKNEAKAKLFMEIIEKDLGNITIYLQECPKYIVVYSPIVVKMFELDKWVEFNSTNLFCRTELSGSIAIKSKNCFRISGIKMEGNYNTENAQFTILSVNGITVLRLWYKVPLDECKNKFILMQDCKAVEINNREYMKFIKC